MTCTGKVKAIEISTYSPSPYVVEAAVKTFVTATFPPFTFKRGWPPASDEGELRAGKVKMAAATGRSVAVNTKLPAPEATRELTFT